MFLAAAFLVFAGIVAYAVQVRVWEDPARHASMPVLLFAMLVLLIYVWRSGSDTGRLDAPVLVAIAADVSLSMGTIPEPATHGDVGTRLERVQRVLLPLFANLGSATQSAMISISAFTVKSETILAWDDDLSLAEEIVEFVLTTGLLTEAGSDLGVALNGAVPLFESLPEDYRGTEYAKFLIIVSDGEQTASRESSDTALAKLRELGVRIVSLAVGSTDIQEGLPVYDENGEFVGFEEVGGQIFSTPNPELMRLVAGEDPDQGLFVQAESTDAVGTITDFVGLQSDRQATNTARNGAVVLLWGLLMFVLLRRL